MYSDILSLSCDVDLVDHRWSIRSQQSLHFTHTLHSTGVWICRITSRSTQGKITTQQFYNEYCVVLNTSLLSELKHYLKLPYHLMPSYGKRAIVCMDLCLTIYEYKCLSKQTPTYTLLRRNEYLHLCCTWSSLSYTYIQLRLFCRLNHCWVFRWFHANQSNISGIFTQLSLPSPSLVTFF